MSCMFRVPCYPIYSVQVRQDVELEARSRDVIEYAVVEVFVLSGVYIIMQSADEGSIAKKTDPICWLGCPYQFLYLKST
jgi:hypothetical protein